ncbi:MAG: hypothetical protein Q8900_13295 [Bacillota bacterium]|nr:hypothetical protein [Bacillota bacterium]
MDFSSLVLMEKDKNTGLFIRELGSYKVNSGAVYITKMFCTENIVNVYFDTNKDVEEWEFSAIFDLFDDNIFTEKGFSIEMVEEEYNPTWLVKFEYIEDYSLMSNKINELCEAIDEAVNKAFTDIEGKESDYI